MHWPMQCECSSRYSYVCMCEWEGGGGDKLRMGKWKWDWLIFVKKTLLKLNQIYIKNHFYFIRWVIFLFYSFTMKGYNRFVETYFPDQKKILICISEISAKIWILIYNLLRSILYSHTFIHRSYIASEYPSTSYEHHPSYYNPISLH